MLFSVYRCITLLFLAHITSRNCLDEGKHQININSLYSRLSYEENIKILKYFWLEINWTIWENVILHNRDKNKNFCSLDYK